METQTVEQPEIPSDDPTPTETRHGLSPFSIAIILVAVFLLIVLGLQLVNTFQTQPTSGPAIDFTLEQFEEMGGGTFTLSENRGKVVVINFWASWCGPCEAEAPAFQAIWESYENSGEVMFVGVDYVDNTQDALGYIEEFNITYFNGPDLETRISDAYRITGVPETFVVGKDGNVFEFFYAPVSAVELQSTIERALAQ